MLKIFESGEYIRENTDKNMHTKIQKSLMLAESGVYWRILTKISAQKFRNPFFGANFSQHNLQNRENCLVSSKFTADIC